MNKIAFTAIASSSLALLIGVAEAEASSTHKTQAGDNLWKIANQYNVSVADLMTWNNLPSDIIFPNQVIKVANADSTVTAPATVPAVSQSTDITTTAYTVKLGDTLSRIASIHKTTISKIQEMNKISNHLIYPGQTLKVNAAASSPVVAAPALSVTVTPAPIAPAPTAETARTYRVVSGDTLTAIAYRNGISVTQLMNWNGLTSSRIGIGQVLKIENSTATPTKIVPVSNPAPPAATDTVGKILETAKKFIGTPYVWGGSTASGFDCSGYIYYVYNQAGIKIPRTNTTGYDARSYDVQKPEIGDLVFFENTYRAGISHMGIYIGNNQFIHAGGDQVQITSLSDRYWSKHFSGFKRLYAMN